MSKQIQISEVHRKMIVHILHTANWLDVEISNVLKKFGITHAQYNILKVLEAGHPNPLSVGEVKNGLLFYNSDMTRLLDRLVKKEYVIRNICPKNRRKIDVEITQSGLKLLENIAPELAEQLEQYFVEKINKEEALHIAGKMKEIRK